MLRRLLRHLGWTGSAFQPDLSHLREITIEDFSSARFAWLHPESGRDVILTADDLSLKRRGSSARMPFIVKTEGIHVDAVLEAVDDTVTLYLGNWFIVPEPLRRRGLATAILLAALDTFDMVRFGSVSRSRDVRLEGCFVNDGAFFARTLCDGVTPTKAASAPINMARMDAARGTLRMLAAPQRR